MPEIAIQTDISMSNIMPIVNEYSEKIILELEHIKNMIKQDCSSEKTSETDTNSDKTDTESKEDVKLMCKYCKKTVNAKGRAKVNHKQRCKQIPTDIKKDRNAICFTDVIVVETHKCICGTLFYTEKELKAHKRAIHNMD